jgi:hypothetical protein
MKKLIISAVLLLASCIPASAQLDTTTIPILPQWLVVINSWGTPACYLTSAIGVANSLLTITVSHGSFNCLDLSHNPMTQPWQAGALISPFNFKHGTISMRGTSAGLGVHSGISFLGDVSCMSSSTCTTTIPYNEADYSEVKPAIGGLTMVYQNYLLNSGGQSGTATVTDAYVNPHVYTMILDTNQITYIVDGVTTNTFSISPIPDNMNVYISTQMDVISGGVPNPANFPETTTVDYVRVSSSTTVTLDSTGAVPIANANLFDEEFNEGNKIIAQGVTVKGATIQ